MVILGALMLAAGGIIVEALLFRGFLEMGRSLGLGAERLGAITALMIFAAALLALELPIAAGLLRAGRGLETGLRMAFLRKIPRLTDRYFHSRPISDMVERCHSVQLLRFLPGHLCPGAAVGVQCFTGYVSFDGDEQSTAGDDCVPSPATVSATSGLSLIVMALLLLAAAAQRLRDAGFHG